MADLTIAPASESRAAWRPPPEECVSIPATTMAPPDGSLERDRIIVRMDTHAATDRLVEFAVIQQTRYHGSWANVCMADSCHDTEVHLHRYGRSTGERIGEPEPISEIHRLNDVGNGYDLAYDEVVENWTANRTRWLDG